MPASNELALLEQARTGSASNFPFFLEDASGVRVFGTAQDFYKAEQTLLNSNPDHLFRTHGLDGFIPGCRLRKAFQNKFAELRGEK